MYQFMMTVMTGKNLTKGELCFLFSPFWHPTLFILFMMVAEDQLMIMIFFKRVLNSVFTL